MSEGSRAGVTTASAFPIFRPEAEGPQSARLCHAGPPSRAGPDVRLCAHFGRSANSASFSEVGGPAQLSFWIRVAPSVDLRVQQLEDLLIKRTQTNAAEVPRRHEFWSYGNICDQRRRPSCPLHRHCVQRRDRALKHALLMIRDCFWSPRRTAGGGRLAPEDRPYVVVRVQS